MELTDDPLNALFAAWRADIDSEPYAHEPEPLIAIPAPSPWSRCTRHGYRGGGPLPTTCRQPCRPA